MLSMFGHVSWDAIENMATWEREFLLDKFMELTAIMHGTKKED